MPAPIIEVERLSKLYRLGTVGAGTLRESLQHWWASRVRRRESGDWQANSKLKIPAGRAGPRPNTMWALRETSFSVNEGETLGIIGRNGAGKSTLLKLLSRITEPTTGRAVIRGRVSSLLEVGTGFHPELTGRENIFLNGTILGMRRGEIRDKLDDIIEFSEIGAFVDTPVKRYSSGMTVRLAFAVAAHLEPDVLIVDEVLAVGDAAYQKKCIDKMREVARQGRTVLFVSHQLSTLANLCDRSILLHDGQLCADGPSREVINQYLNTSSKHSSHRLWETPEDAPGDDIARLHAVTVFCDGMPTDNIEIDRDIVVEIQYWCLRDGARLNPAFILVDKIGTPVFSSPNLPSARLGDDEWGYRPHPAGLYLSRITIPANFLSDGLYRAHIAIQTDASQLNVWEENALTLMVHDTGAMRGEYHNAWMGLIRTRFAWETDKVE
ncbi:ABC transporter ATP-binding protein [Ruficoccus amylovorans]|uniref:ABC transporter ATP-binding protein n=1 Tax=Ruficoccus amylovorans TaxID=1804625 RepID=A0A842HFX4_9BACT|nr:ABC transporter ATP-binding protein [Ruficoccus amylovorans]MBC2594536.1 ABC transporter ATP-binding protein [Ruficoccus amylovorans]